MNSNPTYPKNITEIPMLFFNAISALTFSDKHPKFLSDIYQKASVDYCTNSSEPSGDFLEILEEEEVDYLD